MGTVLRFPSVAFREWRREDAVERRAREVEARLERERAAWVSTATPTERRRWAAWVDRVLPDPPGA